MKQHKSANSSRSSSRARPSTSKRDQVYDAVNFGLDVTVNIAEGSDILAPLKAACRTTKLILEVVQATENNQEEWIDLARRLKGYISALEERVAIFETYPPEDRVVDKAFSQPLIHYTEFLETMNDMVVDLQTKRSRSKAGIFTAFIKIKINAGKISKLN